jgi:hypothetical protein
MSHGPWPRLLAKLSSNAATCFSALDLTSLQRWTLALPRVPWLWALPPREESSGPHLPTEVGSGTAMCPMAPGSASLKGELQCFHVPHGPQRAVDHRNKERPSYPRHAARHTCFQGLLHAFGRHAGDPLNADETCGQAGSRAGPAQQTCSPVIVGCHSAEWFNNFGSAVRSGRQLRCDCNPALASWATCQAPLQA